MEILTTRSRQSGDGPQPSEALSKGLGLFSLGLGLGGVAAPHALSRLIGVQDDRRTRTTLRVFGAREIVQGLGIFARPRHPLPLWARVVGDVVDLGMLAWALRAKSTNTQRVAAALVSVLGVAVIDVVASRRVQRSRSTAREPITSAVTIVRDVGEVYGFWRDFEQFPRFMQNLESVRDLGGGLSHWVAKSPLGVDVEWDAQITEDRPNERIAWQSVEGSSFPSRGSVTFRAAPGRLARTEVIVEMQVIPKGGDAGAVIAKLFAGPQIKGDLRRFKQVIETGEVVHSDASIHRAMHPAQPAARRGARL